ncbi:MAG: hypothetical protein DI586_00175 [Micavibrio aeruginosavorus]|uniref:Uncharacterized protein n=1 Tax=Micavibrio aeruginosavorus TaxID=349221 RepID=A0A2W5HH09_9BACT|nr:MAG: hypothetical protein DI586_00175 [Micavibrio aeruginosavorus]
MKLSRFRAQLKRDSATMEKLYKPAFLNRGYLVLFTADIRGLSYLRYESIAFRMWVRLGTDFIPMTHAP